MDAQLISIACEGAIESELLYVFALYPRVMQKVPVGAELHKAGENSLGF